MNVYYSLFIETRAKREREREREGGDMEWYCTVYACVIRQALYCLVWACVYNVWCV